MSENQNTAIVPSYPDVTNVFQLGEILAKSTYFGNITPQQAVAKLVLGEALGIPAGLALSNIYVVQGRAALTSGAIAARIQQSGKYKYKVKEHTDEKCSITFYAYVATVKDDAGKPVVKWEILGESEFTLADAKKAQLGGANWQKFPKNMLFARALTNGARWYTPEVFGGPIYTPEELREGADGNEPIPVESEPVAPKPAAAAPTQAAPAPAADPDKPKRGRPSKEEVARREAAKAAAAGGATAPAGPPPASPAFKGPKKTAAEAVGIFGTEGVVTPDPSDEPEDRKRFFRNAKALGHDTSDKPATGTLLRGLVGISADTKILEEHWKAAADKLAVQIVKRQQMEKAKAESESETIEGELVDTDSDDETDDFDEPEDADAEEEEDPFEDEDEDEDDE